MRGAEYIEDYFPLIFLTLPVGLSGTKRVGSAYAKVCTQYVIKFSPSHANGKYTLKMD